MKTYLFVIVIIAAVVMPGYAQEEKTQKEGLFSEGSFLSDVFSSATDKLNRVSSGEERIVEKDAKGIPDDILERDGDPFRRQGSTFTREEYRRNREMSEERKREKAD